MLHYFTVMWNKYLTQTCWRWLAWSAINNSKEITRKSSQTSRQKVTIKMSRSRKISAFYTCLLFILDLHDNFCDVYCDGYCIELRPRCWPGERERERYEIFSNTIILYNIISRYLHWSWSWRQLGEPRHRSIGYILFVILIRRNLHYFFTNLPLGARLL